MSLNFKTLQRRKEKKDKERQIHYEQNIIIRKMMKMNSLLKF